jgi:hypothetical protein
MSGADSGTPKEIYQVSPVDCQKLVCHLLVFLVYLSPKYTVRMDLLASDLELDVAKLRNFAIYCGIKSSKSDGAEIGTLTLPLKVKAKIGASPKKKR